MKKIIENFLTRPSSLPKIIAIVGPTASGKTAMSIQAAKNFNGEVINADSKQLYKGIPITSAMISEEEKEGVPHHLFEYVDVSQNYTVEQHRSDALQVIDKLLKENRLPILVGGTGLFINALTQNFDIPKNSTNEELQKELEEKDSQTLWEELLKVDPQYAETTHMNNRVRVIRALEVFYTTGKKKSEATQAKHLFDVLILMPKIDREALYERINIRAEHMWHNGVLDEAKALMKQNLDERLPALTAIGIPEAFAFLKGELDEKTALEKMQQKTRNYAKRQLTWWRNDDRVIEV